MRALHDDQLREYANTSREGFWNESTPVPYRVINQHRRCKGPTLILFKGDAPDGAFAQMPEGCVSRDEGVVWLCVAYGTLVPLMKTRSHTNGRRRAGMQAHAGRAARLWLK